MTETAIRKGLAGVVVDTTEISMVDEASNSLTYRGYPVQDLAESCTFEEVAYLLWYGELPNSTQLRGFTARERATRSLDRHTLELLRKLPETSHPMDVLRTAISYLGADDPTEDDGSVAANRAKAESMAAKLPTVVAADHRRRQGLEPIQPDPELGYADNFFHMCFGEVPDPEVVRCFEVSMILYAEHSFNASTFTARVVTSTLSDIYSSVTAAIGALKGSLHGGANEAVMHMFDEVGSADRAEAWLDTALREERKIMGFGHRVYKRGDSRVPTMRAALGRMADRQGADDLMALYESLEKAMVDRKGIHPNLDYPAGPAYHLMGFETPMFTPLFVMARITGWTAHILEQQAANALIRPLSSYTGRERRPVPLPAQRLAG
ncbi:bifunctional 2-methylcitrate synthase/citrate synthase [Nocardiopsis sp. JB363]|uniref:bifunctional 2-methylcitrate synthase/citrate synthase n=1 Tax=Nocardiopsis sp. JB363 TaxID=1434837 RepID=UPI00097A29F7|nr:bifunctional 2-methylcitrate synthase/citrate synthase [Nocardiopsis sp. JB363]SIO87481.1 2-methylcitrate synthase [Nocardiopsis sp. JB363]